jgi:hypothetical protein
MISQGVYRAKARGGQWGKSTQKGTDFARVAFTIIGGPHDGASIAGDLWFGENSTTRSIESLTACGCTFPGDDITNLAGIDTNEVEIVVEHETYEKDGETKTVAKVAWVNSLAGAVNAQARMNDADKRSFAARMKGTLQHLKQKSGTAEPNGTRPAAPPPAQSSGADDDIPF